MDRPVSSNTNNFFVKDRSPIAKKRSTVMSIGLDQIEMLEK